jgi:hypothetical protein
MQLLKDICKNLLALGAKLAKQFNTWLEAQVKTPDGPK